MKSLKYRIIQNASGKYFIQEKCRFFWIPYWFTLVNLYDIEIKYYSLEEAEESLSNYIKENNPSYKIIKYI